MVNCFHHPYNLIRGVTDGQNVRYYGLIVAVAREPKGSEQDKAKVADSNLAHCMMVLEAGTAEHILFGGGGLNLEKVHNLSDRP